MSDSKQQVLGWRRTGTLSTDHFRVFDVERVSAEHEGSNRTGAFSVIKSPNWVNIIALTPEDKVVLIRQFRHGTQANTTEIPGGMIDAGELPLEAAKRELREETGYTASKWVGLGVVEPNPAIQDNHCYMFLAVDARHTHAPDLDPNEVIDVFETPLCDMESLFYQGVVRHALVVACFGFFVQLSGGWQRPSDEALAKWSPTPVSAS